MGSARLLDHSRSIAPLDYDRWRVPPAALAIYIAVGQVFALGTFSAAFAEVFAGGTDGRAPAIGPNSDYLFAVPMVALGVSAFAFSKWTEAAGPRKAMFVSACLVAAGFLVAALGILLGEITIVYAGYGVLTGIGMGIGYAAPVSTLIYWFPERPGVATGIVSAGVGAGALLGDPLAQSLLEQAARLGAAPVAVAVTFAIMGVCYCALMLFGAFTIRVPNPDWTPPTYTSTRRQPDGTTPFAPRVGTPAGRSDAERRPVAKDVHVDVATGTRQFWLLATMVFLVVTAGANVLHDASPMLQHTFPGVIGPLAATGFVALLGIADPLGRGLLAAWSDIVGRRRAFLVLLPTGAAVLAYVPTAISMSGIVTLVLGMVIAIAIYGGALATMPTYVRDLFGDLHVGPIHARLVFAWSAGAVGGASLSHKLREYAASNGASAAATHDLVLYVSAALLLLAFGANWMIRAVDPELHFVEPAHPAAQAGGSR